ncbi:enoyl-CoA hydratase/isomerase family protein [Sphingosinicella rhizophila]|uniref:Enoyl-CoA hydratase/isomerase family protein n=1 Tax=Sphingosinicella rhizophila TaxID=3050082 RepID=A0ABU3Q5S9_9SPHN|nr:enoyl-CoA hydratase/isomerase family protein [Sphingosinicella sp. GR2756]MDT9598764.1 enoyl-CoA hydratase/isomerase family protein [Sphingosinicella sp. GR2756]
MSDEYPVRFERRGPAAWIILSRPERGNTIDLATARALMELSAACDADQGIRCVVVTGEGKLFCGGGDVQSFTAAGAEAPQLIKAITAHLHVAIATFARMDKPLVTVINGPAAGAGLSLAALGDIALASRSAHFTLAYTAIGLSPDGGASWLLPRLVGLRRAQELVLTNRRMSADEAAEAGLITRAVDPNVLVSEADKVIEALAQGATGALGRSRQLLLSSFGNSLETQMELEARAITASMATADGREGVASFQEKRRPEFGRKPE